jgi:3',5'-cyclic AMP phosphodiesterase CpdA
VYGDMRFTATTEKQATRPIPREALVARIASERPDALFLTGDVPWHGGNQDDYAVYRQETEQWRSERLRVYPVLGNHEFQQCAEQGCLANWWNAFPQFRARRWYAVALGSQLRFLVLDSNASLLPESEQAQWLQEQIRTLPASVRFVIILLHHPPLTEGPEGVRANEAALAAQLAVAAPHALARFVVCAAHVHNYERFERDGMVLLVSGGGGAKPTPITRSSADLYRKDDFPNFHYIRFELTPSGLRGEMVRLSDPESPNPFRWVVSDRFDIDQLRVTKGTGR